MQLDKLRMIIESMLTSSSTLLSMSMAPHKAHTLAPGQIDPEATCPACSLDVGHQVSMLVQRYEQLQDMVNSLVVSRPSKKAKLQRQVGLCSPPSCCNWTWPHRGGSPCCRPTEVGRVFGPQGQLSMVEPFSQIPQESLVFLQVHSKGSSRTSFGDRRPWGRAGLMGWDSTCWLRTDQCPSCALETQAQL